jgi:minor extracellular serine protease Vpr
MTINGALLRGNFMNSGSQGANPAALTLNEYDGYLILDDGSHPIHLAWHVLPRKAARVVADTTDLVPGAFPQVIGLDNTGVGTAQNDAYALLAVSPNLPEGGYGQQCRRPTSARWVSTPSLYRQDSAPEVLPSSGRLRSTPGSGRSICCR